MDEDQIKKDIHDYGFSDHSVEWIREKEGVIVLRLRSGSETAILKYFEKEDFRREIKNYEILGNCGIPTIRVLAKSARSILLEDLESSPIWRLGMPEDLSNPKVIEAIAKWYRLLHTRGERYVQEFGDELYGEWDCFTRENLDDLRKGFPLDACPGFQAVSAHYAELRRRIDEIPRTLTYNDFYYTNLVVRKDESEALMYDYNLLGKGSAVSDIRNVTYWFSEENKQLFLDAYGGIDEKNLILDRILSPVVSLHSARSRGIFPNWAKEALQELSSVTELIRNLF